MRAAEDLLRLHDLKLLEMKGSGSRIYYVLGSRFSTTEKDMASESTSKQQNTHQFGPNTHQTVPPDGVS